MSTRESAVASWPPLPRALEAEGAAAGLRKRLAASAAPLWSGATAYAPHMRLDATVGAVLARAGERGTLVVGLEAAEAALDREERGLAALAARSTAPRPARLSRLLLLADDGAERFYRNAERVTRRHAGRVLTCRLDVPSRTLGRTVLGHDAAVKAVLVQRKDTVAALLRAVAATAERA